MLQSGQRKALHAFSIRLRPRVRAASRARDDVEAARGAADAPAVFHSSDSDEECSEVAEEDPITTTTTTSLVREVSAVRQRSATNALEDRQASVVSDRMFDFNASTSSSLRPFVPSLRCCEELVGSPTHTEFSDALSQVAEDPTLRFTPADLQGGLAAADSGSSSSSSDSSVDSFLLRGSSVTDTRPRAGSEVIPATEGKKLRSMGAALLRAALAALPTPTRFGNRRVKVIPLDAVVAPLPSGNPISRMKAEPVPASQTTTHSPETTSPNQSSESAELECSESECCSICLSLLEAASQACCSSCGKGFHMGCLTRHMSSDADRRGWGRVACPLCREPLRIEVSEAELKAMMGSDEGERKGFFEVPYGVRRESVFGTKQFEDIMKTSSGDSEAEFVMSKAFLLGNLGCG